MLTVHGKRTQGRDNLTRVSFQLDKLTDGTHYVLGNRLRGKLLITPDKDISIRYIELSLHYVISGKLRTSKIKACSEVPSSNAELKAGKTYTYDVLMPFHFGRPNFRGRNLNNFWQLTVDIHPLDSSKKTLYQRLTSKKKDLIQTEFLIPVRSGKGTLNVAAKNLPIPFFDELAIGTGFGLTLAVLIFFMWADMEALIARSLYVYIFLTGLLSLIGYHLLRLASFKLTPMEIKPLRDGKLRLRYLNRGENHLSKARVGIRLREKSVSESSSEETTFQTVNILEQSYALKDIARPKDSLMEAIIPWPGADHPDLPTTYQTGDQGYAWELFLSTPGRILGGRNELRWPIRVGWERMRLTAATESELAEEQLELKELIREKVRR